MIRHSNNVCGEVDKGLRTVGSTQYESLDENGCFKDEREKLWEVQDVKVAAAKKPPPKPRGRPKKVVEPEPEVKPKVRRATKDLHVD